MSQGITLLHLEDDPKDAELVQARLTSAGLACQITRVQTRVEFSDALRQGGYEVILADYRLPGYDGMSALHLAREQCPEVPFIFVSGTMGEDAVIAGLTEGATDYVLKQKLSRLPSAVKRALREAENRRERKQTEEALRESELRYRTLADSGQALIWTSGPGKQCDYFNQPWLSFTGRTLDQELGNGWAEGVHPDDLERCLDVYVGAFDRREAFSLDYRLRHHTGEFRWIQDNGVPRYDSRGNFLGYIGHCLDITDRKQAEAALHQVNSELEQRVEARSAELRAANAKLSMVNRELIHAMRAKDEFLAGMSHELRTPLTAILGLAEMLQMQLADPLTEKQAGYVQTIRTSGEHLLALINDVLDLAKVAAGRLELELGPVSAAETCQMAIALIQPQAWKKQMTVSLALEPAEMCLQADTRRLKQILVNLLGNAVKFTPAGGKVGLMACGDENQHVVDFTVWDTGIGIVAEDLPRLFQDFVQLDTRLARLYEGTGLGLALVRRLVELHGGHVKAESDGPGQGSRFTVSLPWPDEKPLGRPTENNPGETGSATRGMDSGVNPAAAALILVADNNPAFLEALQSALSARGYQVALAEDGEAALAQTRQLHPAVIVMDVQMPKLDGLEAMRQMRADPALAAIPILAVTALAMPGDRERCLEAGANAYLAKPVSLAKLAQTIETLRARRLFDTPKLLPTRDLTAGLAADSHPN